MQVAVELDEVLGRADGNLLQHLASLAGAEGRVEEVVDGVC